MIALFAALAGTAVAEVATTARLDKKEKKQVRKIAKKQANKQITKRAPGLSVAFAEEAGNAETANTANSANTAGSANTATNATNADNADHANSANTAGTASSANTVGGLAATKISYSAAANTGAQTIFAGAGLRLTASCGAAGELDLDATTTKNDSNIFLTSVHASAANTTEGFNQENQNFDAGSTIEVEDVLLGGDQENATIQYVAPDGAIATVQVALDDDDAADVCQVSGFGMRG